MLSLEQQLKRADAEALTFNSREALFGLPLTDYSRVKKLLEQFDPFMQFWSAASSWSKGNASWLTSPLASLDGEQVDKEVGNVHKTTLKMGKVFGQRGLAACAQNCESLKADVEAFRGNVPLLLALRAPGMRERHWERLTDELKMPVNLKGGLSLQKCIDMGLPAHSDLITKVSELAGKEHAIETALDKIEAGWKDSELQVRRAAPLHHSPPASPRPAPSRLRPDSSQRAAPLSENQTTFPVRR